MGRLSFLYVTLISTCIVREGDGGAHKTPEEFSLLLRFPYPKLRIDPFYSNPSSSAVPNKDCVTLPDLLRRERRYNLMMMGLYFPIVTSIALLPSLPPLARISARLY